MQTDTVNSPEPDLEAMLASLPARHEPCSLGVDIDAANVMLLDPNVDQEDKKAQFRQWASRYQPCMFGRLGARGTAGIHYDICWIDRAAMCNGRAHVKQMIQQARQAWKECAARGLSHGLLTMFNAPELAFAPHGAQLLATCRSLCDLFLVEHAPVAVDTIYTESLPLADADGTVACLRGGINVFYGAAHRTRNHDRRVPGGFMISVNSPGLLAHSWVKRGLAPDLTAALERVRMLAWASIGNGGISRGQRNAHSCSWHNADASRPSDQCPMKHRPLHVPENFSSDRYSALYHTDVLLPSSVMLDPRQDLPHSADEVWPHLDFEYLSTLEHAADHENFGFVHGQRVQSEPQSQHIWAPRAPLAFTVREASP